MTPSGESESPELGAAAAAELLSRASWHDELLSSTARGWAGMLTGQAGFVRLIAQDLESGITEGAIEDLRIVAGELLGAAAAIDRIAQRIGGMPR